MSNLLSPRSLLHRRSSLLLVCVLSFACQPSGTRTDSNTPHQPSGREPGVWGLAESQPIIDKTQPLRLDPDLSPLSEAESSAVAQLLAAGRIMENIYQDERHHQAVRARRHLAQLARRQPSDSSARNLVELYEVSSGPIATTLDNQRLPFLAVDSLVPGKNFYPWGVSKAEIDSFLARHPDRRETLLDPRTVVRRADAATVRADLAALSRHPALATLHLSLAGELRALERSPNPQGFYAVPYAVAHADSLMRVYELLNGAAAAVEASDRPFARYLRLRARDLLANDYESGDAAWVTSRFGRLNAQIGAYETYDDELYGVKAGHSLSLLLTDSLRTAQVRSAIQGLQSLENSLPYSPHKKVIEDIPIGVYDVIADFGQARGTNTASILPNDADLARRYGRIILMRRNILTHPDQVAAARTSFQATVQPAHHGDLDAEGSFQRVLWHEIGHYLGPDQTREGRTLDLALEEEASTFEEMKADLVSLFVAKELWQRGYYDDSGLRSVYASGVLRMLQKNRPRPDQSYGVMQLMQLNWFLERGVLAYDPVSETLSIHYDRYHDTVASLIEQVLGLQYAGDLNAARQFIARWTAWDKRHESLAEAMRAAETSRFRRMQYAALGE